MTYPSHWFLNNNEYTPSRSTIEFLINGEATFSKLYDEIKNAKKSVDILIWGFQPSMFFKREGQSLCIGDLLIEVAMRGVEVRVLVWSLPQQLQTVQEANLGSSFVKREKYHTDEQITYDKLWYGLFFKKKNISILENPQKLQKLTRSGIYNTQQLKKANQLSKRLKFETHMVDLQANTYADNTFLLQRAVLALLATHHQKTVLIDYMDPPNAKGFVLEHNMLDNYWDTSKHLATNEQDIPYSNTKRNAGPMQDVSSFVRGEILHDINANFCQSWTSTTVFSTQYENLTSIRVKEKSEYALKNLEDQLFIQAVRTYDKGNIENVKELYLQNIKKVTSYIYTENQYFRWKPLVEEFKSYWEEKLKTNGRTAPIYWFVVTNSSDAGIGSGTAQTDEMLKMLGRRDVMPNVAIAYDNEVNKQYEAYKSAQTPEQQAEEVRKRNEAMKREAELKGEDPNQKKKNEKDYKVHEDNEFTKKLYEDVSNTVGIKTHICVLSAKDSWEEVYVHSKVTIMNDVFVTMGSSNINTRSMQADTELNIAMECGAKAKQLRKALWGLHSVNRIKLNPEDMHLPTVAGDTFEVWSEQLDLNLSNKKAKGLPIIPLTPFFRADPKVSKLD